jgi:hypothetical protein
MSRKTPQEKKNLEYKKERRTGSLHGYVKSYPKTKARINKASRHEANAVLKGAGIESLQSAVEVTDDDAITRERLQHSIERAPGADFKAYPHTLKEWVGSRLEGRVQFAGDRYFAEAYKSERHRKGFSKYLQTILSGRSAKSFEIARFYEEVLNPSALEAERYHARRRAWLRAFFRDEPEYECKLRAWMQEMEHLYSTR